MYCNQCGTKVNGDATICPECGYKLPVNQGPGPTETGLQPPEEPAPMYDEPEALLAVEEREAAELTAPPEQPAAGEPEGAYPLQEADLPAAALTKEPAPPQEEPEVEEPRRGVKGCGWAMVAGMLAGCAILLVIGIGLLAVYHGLQERTGLNRAAATDHYHKGLEQFSAENYELARAEFELALRLDPQNLDAETKLAEVNAVLSRQPTPTSAVRRQTAMLLYNEARDLYNKGDWEGAIGKLEQVQVMEPEYERDQVTLLLVEAYYKAGLRLLSENRLEEAIRYFDSALQLRPGEQTIRDEKRYASLYVAGLSYWGANWQGAIDTFHALYQVNPNYRDTRQRLYDAYVAYGDSLYAKTQWCSARDQYDSALAMTPGDDLKAKRDDAAQQCIVAALPTATPLPSGTFVGQLLRTEDVGSPTAMMIRGYVWNVEGKPMAGVRVGLSAGEWSASPATTNAEGLFAFDGLGNPVTYTIALLDVPAVSLAVKADWSKLAWVEFRPRP